MTSTVEGRDAAEGARAGGLARLARLARLPLAVHALVLAVVLAAGIALVGGGGGFLPDEGAAILQARTLEETGSWTVPHPLPEVDPEGEAFPIRHATPGDEGWAPLAKHPTYAALLSVQPLGVTGMVLVSVAGTVAAAVVAALLARRIDPRLDVATLWVVGVASPLFFDSYLVLAHTLGAALVAATVLLVVRAHERSAPPLALLAALPMVGAVLLRNEALLLAGALGLVAAVLAWRERSPALGLAAAVLPLAALVAWWADPRLTAVVVPGAGAEQVTAGAAHAGFLGARVQALLITAVLPGYRFDLAALLLLVGTVALVLGALRARRGDGAVVLWWGVAAACYVLRLALEPGAVPGLLVAFPLLTVGLVVLSRPALATTAARLAFGTSAVFAAAVAATQYAKGGTGEWGARYVAICLPLVVPVVLGSLLLARRRLAERAPGSVRPATAALGIVTAATVLLAGLALRANDAATSSLTDAVVDQAAEAAPPDDGGRPVVVTTVAAVPRWAWDRFDEARWLLVDEDDLGTTFDRLGEHGVPEAVVVVRGDVPASVGGDGAPPTVERSTPDGGWDVRTVALAGSLPTG